MKKNQNVKTVGNFTVGVGRCLRGLDQRIFCKVNGDDIFVTNGYTLYKMQAREYDALVRPIICRDPGDWAMDKNGKHFNSHSLRGKWPTA